MPGPNYAILSYGDRIERLATIGPDFWVDIMSYTMNNTHANFVRDCSWNQYVIFAGTTTADRTPQQGKLAMQVFARANPDFYSAAWCKNTPGRPLDYAVGKYYPSTRGNRVLEQVLYDCPHCAMTRAKEILTSRNQLSRGPSVLLAPENAPIPRDCLPYQGEREVIGEGPVDSTATIKDYTGSPGFACGNCGRLNHTSRNCGYEAKHFDRIGVELEGRFHELARVKDRCDDRGLTYSGDGSIHESPDSDAEAYELKTKPGSLRECIEQVRDFYPDETDKSCGMHVHVSFLQPEALTLLHTKAFFSYFKERWTAWGTAMNLEPAGQFFQRLNGDNDYCNPNDSTPRDMTSCDRYSQLNFGSWRGHKTLECRLLPMFRRSSLAVAAITELISIYEDFLSAPEAYGHAWAPLTDAGVPESVLAPLKHQLANHEIDLLAMRRHEQKHELELTELLPPADNMVRIALPVNQPITVENLSARLQALRAA